VLDVRFKGDIKDIGLWCSDEVITFEKHLQYFFSPMIEDFTLFCGSAGGSAGVVQRRWVARLRVANYRWQCRWGRQCGGSAAGVWLSNIHGPRAWKNKQYKQ
jgi:hypothetical protein